RESNGPGGSPGRSPDGCEIQVVVGAGADVGCAVCTWARHGTPTSGSRYRSKPMYPATFQPSISPIAIVKSTGFDDDEPASMNDEFIRAPKNAAGPVSVPVISPMPTRSSPNTISQANQTYHWLFNMNWRNSRYQS